MKFGKQLDKQLKKLPPEWHDQVIKYHDLKKTIKDISNELESLGLTNEILQELLLTQPGENSDTGEHIAGGEVEDYRGKTFTWHASYELGDTNDPQPHLQIEVSEWDADVPYGAAVSGHTASALASDPDAPPTDSEEIRVENKEDLLRVIKDKRQMLQGIKELSAAANDQPQLSATHTSQLMELNEDSATDDPATTSHSESENLRTELEDDMLHMNLREKRLISTMYNIPTGVAEGEASDGDFTDSKSSGLGEHSDSQSSSSNLVLSGDAEPASEPSKSVPRVSEPSKSESNNPTPSVRPQKSPPTEKSPPSEGTPVAERTSDSDTTPRLRSERSPRFRSNDPSRSPHMKNAPSRSRRPRIRRMSSSSRKFALPSALLPPDAASSAEDADADDEGITQNDDVAMPEAPGNPAYPTSLGRAPRSVHSAKTVREQLKVSEANDARAPRGVKKRIVNIPISFDAQFIRALTEALASLETLELAQRTHFASEVEKLAESVSLASSPSRNRTDVSVWREIFSLWIEIEIFSTSRVDEAKGESRLSVVDKMESRLDAFVTQVGRQRLAERLHHRDSRKALRDFIRLNVLLLNLYRLHETNEEAIRKILKKHDKRTALSASNMFPSFVRHKGETDGLERALAKTEKNLPGSLPPSHMPLFAGRAKASTFILPNIPDTPRILLTHLTSRLLPVIPPLEDYTCLVCGDVLYQPIRLDCGHTFCARCLMTLQRKGEDRCPLCREPVVLRAGRRNLDDESDKFVQLWFPDEVKEKRKRMKELARREHIADLAHQPDDTKCLVM